MAENDHRGDPSEVNPEGEIPPPEHPQQWLLVWFFSLVTDWLSQWFPVPPRLVPGTVVLRKDLLRNLQISNHTLSDWVRQGLRSVPDLGTKSEIFLADDVIAYLKTKQSAAA